MLDFSPMDRSPSAAITADNLLAELERCEQETARLARVIRSPHISPDRRARALERRDELQDCWVSLIVQLDTVRHEPVG